MESRPFVSHQLADISSQLQLHSNGDVLITGITHESRDVRSGDLFVAIPGLEQHGINFLDQAKSCGAVAVASDEHGCERAKAVGMPYVLLQSPRLDMAHLAQHVYGYPDKNLQLIGVTGTNGKTTVTQMLRHMLTEMSVKVGVIGTLGAFIGSQQIPTGRTTPESTDLYALLAQMHASGVETVCMEVSSHALALDRVAGLHFAAALFTNLSQDHLDFHGDMESYFATKARLFESDMTDLAIINADTDWGKRLIGISSAQSIATVGSQGQWKIDHVRTETSGQTVFDFTAQGEQHHVVVPMFGSFNAGNAALCLTALQLLNRDLHIAISALKSLPQVPGRFEVAWHSDDKLAIVDYAHTPDAIEKVLKEIRAVQPKRIITVFGCGGDRDPAKRPIMGQVAASQSDIVIVTDDNPRSEDPASIRNAILAGIDSAQVSVEVIPDRRLAIRQALILAEPGDVIAILGKGHETGQEIAGVVTPFDDREVTREEATHA